MPPIARPSTASSGSCTRSAWSSPRKGVTVNAVCPGYTETPLLEAAVDKIAGKTGRSAADARAELAKDNAHGRLIAPEEVAQAVLWLCSPAAASVNGQAIAIAGGQL